MRVSGPSYWDTLRGGGSTERVIDRIRTSGTVDFYKPSCVLTVKVVKFCGFV